jgi:hypothetical protein
MLICTSERIFSNRAELARPKVPKQQMVSRNSWTRFGFQGEMFCETCLQRKILIIRKEIDEMGMPVRPQHADRGGRASVVRLPSGVDSSTCRPCDSS